MQVNSINQQFQSNFQQFNSSFRKTPTQHPLASEQ